MREGSSSWSTLRGKFVIMSCCSVSMPRPLRYTNRCCRGKTMMTQIAIRTHTCTCTCTCNTMHVFLVIQIQCTCTCIYMFYSCNQELHVHVLYMHEGLWEAHKLLMQCTTGFHLDIDSRISKILVLRNKGWQDRTARGTAHVHVHVHVHCI